MEAATLGWRNGGESAHQGAGKSRETEGLVSEEEMIAASGSRAGWPSALVVAAEEGSSRR